MKFLMFFTLLVLLLSVNALPTKKLLIASTKDLGATLVRVPSARFGREFWRQSMNGCGNRRRRKRKRRLPTAPPSTTDFIPSSTDAMTTTESMPTKTKPIPNSKNPPSSGGNPPSGGGPPSGTGSCVSCSVENFNTVNDYRASNGLNKLGWSDHLADLADQWSKEMYDTSVFKHSDFKYWENIIWGYGLYTWNNVAQGFFEGWKDSPGHDQNMRLPTHKCMGVGVYGDGTKFYGTQIFSNNCP